MSRRLGSLYCHQQDATKLGHTVSELSGTMVAECAKAGHPEALEHGVSRNPMKMTCKASIGAMVAVLLAGGGCSRGGNDGSVPAAPSTVTNAAASPADKFQSVLVVHKNESCGCCGEWVKHVQRAGFNVEVHNESNLNDVKVRLGVPAAKGSCHTAEIDGYLIEGHVPAEDIRRLLAERPDARGLVVAGMPAGAPGMEVADGHVDPYTVELVERDGTTKPFSVHAGTPARR